MQLLAPDDYQSRVADNFARVAGRLRALLPSAQIEHVGSSSIPGAISRGDLDICVLVTAGDFEAVCGEIKGLGYAEKQDTLRTSELCMLVPTTTGDDHAIQLVSIGSEFEFFLAFRDTLRADAELVIEYNRIKGQSAPFGEAAYREAKSAFIRGVIAASRGLNSEAQRQDAAARPVLGAGRLGRCPE